MIIWSRTAIHESKLSGNKHTFFQFLWIGVCTTQKLPHYNEFSLSSWTFQWRHHPWWQSNVESTHEGTSEEWVEGSMVVQCIYRQGLGTASVIKSLLVANCIKKLTALSEVNQVTIIRIPGHSSIQSKETIDNLAREGAKNRPISTEPFLQLSLSRFNPK